MFKAALWMQKKGTSEADKLADAVVLEVGEPNDPVLINERFGWDDKWAVVRVIPGYDDRISHIEQNYWGVPYNVNHDWLAVDAYLKVRRAKDMEEMFPRPQFTGTWVWGPDDRCSGKRLLVFRDRWITTVDSTNLFDFNGRAYFIPGRSSCSDVPESP